MWPETATPGTVDHGADAAVELGVKFRSDVEGTIRGVRFYKASTNTGTHVGNLWSAAGTLLASGTFSDESASGWQEVRFATPVRIAPNTTYVASYHTDVGHYSCDRDYFAESAHDRVPLHAIASAESGGNGVFAFGSTSTFPSESFLATNYWVDVVFSTGDASPPSTISVTPADLAMPVESTIGFTAIATYSDGTWMDVSNPATWVSADTGVATVAANGVSSAKMAGTTTISATYNGVTGSTSLTVHSAFTGASLWTPIVVPGTVDRSDDCAVELGVKFRSDVAGEIVGIRFYKASANTGTHVGNLWTDSGTLLASAAFSGETVSGWQEVRFAAPAPSVPTQRTSRRITQT